MCAPAHSTRESVHGNWGRRKNYILVVLLLCKPTDYHIDGRYNSLSIAVSECIGKGTNQGSLRNKLANIDLYGGKLFTSFVISLEPSNRRLGYKRNCYVVFRVTLCDKHETSVKWPQCQDGNLILI